MTVTFEVKAFVISLIKALQIFQVQEQFDKDVEAAGTITAREKKSSIPHCCVPHLNIGVAAGYWLKDALPGAVFRTDNKLLAVSEE